MEPSNVFEQKTLEWDRVRPASRALGGGVLSRDCLTGQVGREAFRLAPGFPARVRDVVAPSTDGREGGLGWGRKEDEEELGTASVAMSLEGWDPRREIHGG